MTRFVLLVVCVLLTTGVGTARAFAQEHRGDRKLDAALRVRAHAIPTAPRHSTSSRIIIRTVDGLPATTLVTAVGGTVGRFFATLGAQVADVPDASLDWLASQPEIDALSLDRAVRDTMQRTATSIGALWVGGQLGVSGTGVGVATIDSGVSPTHPDLDGRVLHFADFVGRQVSPYDDYGHGTHVAGIVAGSGRASNGARRGVAPGAHLVVLKALDQRGVGFTSNVIAAIEYAIEHRRAFNIRVINLSVAASVYESYLTDPLTVAARRAVDAGIVVVAAAGNRGRTASGNAVYGGIASPGNAPWVLTVGAISENGTTSRNDDAVAEFSSRGPSALDLEVKPDVVAPGVAIESTTEPSSALFNSHPGSRLWGAQASAHEPYLSLTGTSMSAPVVSGVVALMIEANPRLTPNAVKAIVQYTAETRAGVDYLTQGAGFLNARGAVELSRTLADPKASSEPLDEPLRWGRHVIWGNRRIGGRLLDADPRAWALGVTWGAKTGPDGEPIEWAACGDGGCEPVAAPPVPACQGGDDCRPASPAREGKRQ